ncbi:hypothetical protein [Mycobacterium kansasii]|uniref:hypothetical protein n=1 Tax=Mycobacterium kansasii TaxID=1768 RepID=UPI0011596671|nr:hypothetical protein [Mycobacterium kansasii]
MARRLFCAQGVKSQVVVFAVEPAVVGASAMTQAGLAARLGAGVAGCADGIGGGADGRGC